MTTTEAKLEVLRDLLLELGSDGTSGITRWMDENPDFAVEAVDACKVMRPWKKDEDTSAEYHTWRRPLSAGEGGESYWLEDDAWWTDVLENETPPVPWYRGKMESERAAMQRVESYLISKGYKLASPLADESGAFPSIRRITLADGREVKVQEHPAEHGGRGWVTSSLCCSPCALQFEPTWVPTGFYPRVQVCTTRPCPHGVIIVAGEYATSDLVEAVRILTSMGRDR